MDVVVAEASGDVVAVEHGREQAYILATRGIVDDCEGLEVPLVAG